MILLTLEYKNMLAKVSTLSSYDKIPIIICYDGRIQFIYKSFRAIYFFEHGLDLNNLPIYISSMYFIVL